ncbi:hypothetical protein [Comamonas sp. C24C]
MELILKGIGVIRDLEFKGALQHTGRGRVVNNVLWGRQTLADQDCQDRDDVKALTGRGTLSRLRQKLDGIDALLKQMHDLSEKSKSVPGLSFYLVVHQKNTTGYVFLRWRQRMGSNRHLSFEEVEKLAAGLPIELRQWCMAASKRAVALNEEHQQTRSDIKRIRVGLDKAPVFLYPRSPISPI